MTRLHEGYIRQMKSLLGEAGFSAYEAALQRPWERALRLNGRLCPAPAREAALFAFCGEPVPWAKDAFFVSEGARPGLSPLHEAGLYYLQEPSAMAPVAVLDPQPGERVLDLCAAPGGKSTQIADALAGRGLLVANEPAPERARVLARNLERMGVPNAVVTQALPEQLSPRLEGFFDRVLVDAPCSGEGLFRRQPEAVDEWDEDAPARCAARQSQIMEHASRMLRPGGRLVYSTCTFNRKENEEVIGGFLAAHPSWSLRAFALPGLPSAEGGMLHLFPHEIRGEGHFVACLQKAEDDAPPMREKLQPERPKTARPVPAPLLPADVFAAGSIPDGAQRVGDVTRLLPDGFAAERLEGVRILRAGLTISLAKGRRAEPDHALAMAMRREQAARFAELTEQQAALYQAGEALNLGDLPAGYTLLCLYQKPLGWGKQAGGMMKNHYPKGLWRRS